MLKTCCTLLAFGLAAVPALAADSGAATTAEVTVTVVFPTTLDSFDAHSVKVFLSQSDPQSAPVPGQKVVTTYEPVDTQQIDNVSHVKGKESQQVVVVGSKVKLDSSLKYLVSAQVLADNKFKGSAMLNNAPTVPVLTGESRRAAVTLTVMHLNK